MPNGKNHGFEIQTRQKDDELFRLDSLTTSPLSIPVAGFVQLAIRRVEGYGAIRFLVISPEIMVLRIEEAPTPDGPWVETVRVTGAVTTSGAGTFFICTEVSPCGVFMRVFLDNGGVGAVTPDLIGLGHPIAGGGGSGGGGGGGTSSIVQLRDGSISTTLVSVKVDGAVIGPQGSILVGAEGPGGIQQALQVDGTGALIVTSSGGGGFPPNQPTFAVNQQTVPIPGTAAQLQAQAVPDGFQIFIRALLENNGKIYVGPDAATAQNHAIATPLEPGAFLELALTNVNAVFIDSDDANDGVSWTVEVV